jgi:hypothetical protein
MAAPSLAQQVSLGGIVNLPAGTITLDCSNQFAISKGTIIQGQGRGVTIINDTCPTGDTFNLDLSAPGTMVKVLDLTVIHNTTIGTVLNISGDGGKQSPAPTVVVSSVDFSQAQNCITTSGLNLFFLEKSIVRGCGSDGARISSFGVTLHDNWFEFNGGNGVSFVGAGFCASCFGNEYNSNFGHGFVYDSSEVADARHINEYVDSNGDVGVVVRGARDFTFNNGWVGTNRNGGMIVGDTALGTALVGNTFTNNFGPNLVVDQSSSPLRLAGNLSSMPHDKCDVRVNGICKSMND